MVCFSEKNSAAFTIFTSLVDATASLATGGQFSEVGQMVGSLMQLGRETKFMKNMANVDRSRFRNSISCLVESTQESYCALHDAEDALDFMRGNDGKTVIKYKTVYDPMRNPMRGLLILLREVPTVSAWIQRVLFGIDPRTENDANVKNDGWSNIIEYIKMVNKARGLFRDKRDLYFTEPGADYDQKTAQILDIMEDITNALGVPLGGGGGAVRSKLNFVTRAMSDVMVPFFLLGLPLDPTFNPMTNSFATLWNKYVGEKSHGLDNPDLLLETINKQLDKLISKANVASTRYMSARMVVDAHNLLIDGMNGPDISPYKALIHIRTYLNGLTGKLENGMHSPEIMARPIDYAAYRAVIPLLGDLVARLNRMIKAMDRLGEMKADIREDMDIEVTAQVSSEIMSIFYQFANMLTSRDSFISTRVQNAVRMDITDTLWRSQHLSENQNQLLRVLSKDLILQLSAYFGENPVLQRLDIAAAYESHNENLKTVDNMFSQILLDQILELNCKLYGGRSCDNNPYMKTNPGFFVTLKQSLYWMLDVGELLQSSREFFGSAHQPTTNQRALKDLRAKLCTQSLGFPQSWEFFEAPCHGAQLISEFSDGKQNLELNLNYGTMVTELKALHKEKRYSEFQTKSTCALRSYIRRNHVYMMYRELHNDAP